MATLEERFEWLKQNLNDQEGNYSGFFKMEIADYFEIDEITADDLETSLNKKFETFQTCNSFEDVQEFIYRIVGYIQMHTSTEEIIADYLSAKSGLPIKFRNYNQ
jgi:hypothetical protein